MLNDIGLTLLYLFMFRNQGINLHCIFATSCSDIASPSVFLDFITQLKLLIYLQQLQIIFTTVATYLLVFNTKISNCKIYVCVKKSRHLLLLKKAMISTFKLTELRSKLHQSLIIFCSSLIVLMH